MSGAEAGPLTIAEAARLIAARRLSPIELTRTLLARIAALDPEINAFLTVTARKAEAEARTAEKALKARKRGRLLGIPLAYKDIFATAGVRTTAHSRLLAENVPKESAESVRRLAEAGAVMLGKLATHEFAIGGPAFDLPWPPARNPWDPERFTGGSSSGAGAAIAAGLALGALGSDTGGSIRIPAAYCGIAGIKPTPGLVSRRGVIPLAPSLDTVGPMAWTAEDCALLLDVLAGYDPADPASVPGPKVSYARAITAPVKGLRIGLVRHFHERDVPAGAETLRMIATLVRLLPKLGCRVEEATLPSVHEYNAVGRVIISAEAYALHEANLRTRLSDYSRTFRIRVLAGGLIRAADYLAAQRQRTDLIVTTARAFERFDLLLTAAVPGPAPLLKEQRADEGFAVPFLTTPANVAAIPAAVVCGGFSATGLPLGVQIMGPAWGDALVLRLAHHLERAAGTRTRRPVLALSARCEKPREWLASGVPAHSAGAVPPTGVG
ncbi:MAG: amidase [Rhodospirillales bacterium]|nr:amidase [Rhodospirillales bacterium]